MAHANSPLSLAMAMALGFAGAACGGADSNMQPQTPPNSTAATTTTGAAADQSATSGMMTGSNPNPGSATSGVDSPMQSTAGTPPTGGVVAGTSTTGATATGTASSTSAPSTTLSDAQIAAIVRAADTGEIEQAHEAMRKAKSPRVKQFAQHMITDHSAAETKLTGIDNKAGITPQEGTMSEQIKSDGAQIMLSLKSASGLDLDKAYIDAQVTEHNQVLDALDNKLIPQAQNADLKSALQDVRSKVAGHLKMAQDIQSSLTKK